MSGLRSGRPVALGRQEESGLFGDAQLSQKRELIHSSSTRVRVLPSLDLGTAAAPDTVILRLVGGSWVRSPMYMVASLSGVGAARLSTGLRTVIAPRRGRLSTLEVDVGEGRYEALVVAYTHRLVQWDRHTGMLRGRSPLARRLDHTLSVAGVERFDDAQRRSACFLSSEDHKKCLPSSAFSPARLAVPHALH